MKTKSYIPGVNGLKALAIVMIILYHIGIPGFLEGGFIGVDIFLVISGYLICRSLNKQSIIKFYKKRFLRIGPPLFITLLITMMLATLFIPSSWLSRTNSDTGLAAFFGISNFILVNYADNYFSPRVDYNPFVHTWFLGVITQYIIVFPFLFLMLKNKKKRALKITGLTLLVLLTLASAIACYIESSRGNLSRTYYLLHCRFWELSSGALLFFLHNKTKKLFKHKAINSISSLAGLLILIYCSIYTRQSTTLWNFLPVLATLMLISALEHNCETVISRVLEFPIIRTIGKVSYSLYLWHWSILVLFNWTVGLNTPVKIASYIIIVAAFSLLSYLLIEVKLRAKINSQNKLIIIVITSVLLLLLSWLIDKNQSSLSLSVTKDTYIWKPWRHKSKNPSMKDKYPELDGKRLFVVGDSHAAAYRTMINEVSHQLGIESIEYERGGYHVGNLLYPMSSLDDQDYYENIFKTIKSKIKNGDIIFLASLRMPEISNAFEITNIDDVLTIHFSENERRKRSEAVEELSLLIDEFTSLGAKVLIDAPKPVLKAPPYRCSDWFNKNNPIASPGIQIDKELLITIREPMMESLEYLKARHENLYVWDPFFTLCESEELDGNPLFFDDNHLTAHGNRVLLPTFIEKLLDIWRKEPI